MICRLILLLLLISSCGDESSSKIPIGEPIRQVINRPLNSKAINLVRGRKHVCVHLEDYTVKCWGNSQYNVLNMSSARNAQKKYYDVTDAEFSQIAAGGLHTCGILLKPPYEGIPVCFGFENEWLDVPHEKVKEISVGHGFTCVIRQDDTLYCTGILMFSDGISNIAKISAQEFPKLGVDPISGSDHQDYSHKKFKNLKCGFNVVCARALDDNGVYCMGSSAHKGLLLGAKNDFIDYFPGHSNVKLILNSQKIYNTHAQMTFYSFPNLAKPNKLKYKKIFNDRAYLTARGNKYDDGSIIPENTLIHHTNIGPIKHDIAEFIEVATSDKPDRLPVYFYLTNKGKLGCINCHKQDIKSRDSEIVNNIPKEIME